MTSRLVPRRLILYTLTIACCPYSILEGATNYSDPLRDLPLRFEENRGQAPGGARYIARALGYEFRLESTRNVLLWANPQRNNLASIETRFLGANPSARLQPEALMEAKTNYLIGNVPANWRREMPNYGQVRVAGVYPGIDLVFYGKSGAVEYDFVIQPGANPESIRFEISGAKSIRLAPDGDLVLETSAGEVCWKKPALYQDLERGRKPIDGVFELLGGKRVGFRVGRFDRRKALVIDPTLSYSSFFGSPSHSEIGFERALGIGLDSAGNAYIAGITASNDLPVTAGALQTAFGGSTANIRYLIGDAFVAKFTPAGALSYVTYLGGSGDDIATGIVVDGAGDAYLVGSTNSKDFPTTPGVLQRALKGSGGNSCVTFGDAFVAKLNPSGTQLLYSTYLGGSLDDFGWAIQIDAQGDAYVAGATLSSDFPVVNAKQGSLKGSGGEPGRPSCNGAPLFDAGDAFVAKLNPTATQLVFSTYLGGSLDDAALAIALDSALNVYVGGYTLSSDFPFHAQRSRSERHGRGHPGLDSTRFHGK
jgi:Beta-propeller repeat